ncbi:hypothetical protein EYF80_031200 [Liparis tanakae]|uniref:Uncharacterized protein n=1 Tax=Liparis tanakae TaxID=230148 RepID=A0A4Z2GZA3_9TELE|nr:hypothetical protein EYF80_031200 [Liparis tanakae]
MVKETSGDRRPDGGKRLACLNPAPRHMKGPRAEELPPQTSSVTQAHVRRAAPDGDRRVM